MVASNQIVLAPNIEGILVDNSVGTKVINVAFKPFDNIHVGATGVTTQNGFKIDRFNTEQLKIAAGDILYGYSIEGTIVHVLTT